MKRRYSYPSLFRFCYAIQLQTDFTTTTTNFTIRMIDDLRAHFSTPLVKVQHGNTKVKESPTLLKKGPYTNELSVAFTRIRDKDGRSFTQIELINRVLITQNDHSKKQKIIILLINCKLMVFLFLQKYHQRGVERERKRDRHEKLC